MTEAVESIQECGMARGNLMCYAAAEMVRNGMSKDFSEQLSSGNPEFISQLMSTLYRRGEMLIVAKMCRTSLDKPTFSVLIDHLRIAGSSADELRNFLYAMNLAENIEEAAFALDEFIITGDATEEILGIIARLLRDGDGYPLGEAVKMLFLEEEQAQINELIGRFENHSEEVIRISMEDFRCAM